MTEKEIFAHLNMEQEQAQQERIRVADIYPGIPKAGKGLRANARQVDGQHYKLYGDLQPWDLWELWQLNPFQAAMLKHVARYPHKGEAILDLEKIIHYAQKALEIERAKTEPAGDAHG